MEIETTNEDNTLLLLNSLPELYEQFTMIILYGKSEIKLKIFLMPLRIMSIENSIKRLIKIRVPMLWQNMLSLEIRIKVDREDLVLSLRIIR